MGNLVFIEVLVSGSSICSTGNVPFLVSGDYFRKGQLGHVSPVRKILATGLIHVSFIPAEKQTNKQTNNNNKTKTKQNKNPAKWEAFVFVFVLLLFLYLFCWKRCIWGPRYWNVPVFTEKNYRFFFFFFFVFVFTGNVKFFTYSFLRLTVILHENTVKTRKNRPKPFTGKWP